RAYQRMINGEFDELTGGWAFSGKNFDFVIDTTGQISGTNSAKIVANADDEGSGILKWPMVVEKGESFDFSLKTKGSENARLKIFFTQGAEESVLAERLVKTGDDVR